MKKFLLVSLALLLLLSGCDIFVSTEGFLNLKAFERWTLLYSLDIRASTIQLLGADISENLNNEVKKLEEQGLDASWEQTEINEEGITSIILIVKGTGYDKLEILGVSVDEYKDDGKDILKINIDTGGRLSYQDYFGLKGGKIISTNGEKISADTVRWINETDLVAIMEKPGTISMAFLFALAFSLFVIIIAFGLVSGFSKKTPGVHYDLTNKTNQDISKYQQPPYSRGNDDGISEKQTTTIEEKLRESNQQINLSSDAQEQDDKRKQERKFCPFCGQPWVPDAIFCTFCGKRG